MASLPSWHRWKALSAEEKKKWADASALDQQRYLDECKQMGIEPKLYPHIAGQVRIARPDRLLNGETENLVDPALMGVGRSPAAPLAITATATPAGAAGPSTTPPPAAAATGAAAAAEAPKRVERPDQPSDSKALRWCARTRSFV